METVLQQVKRRGERMMERPGVRPALEGAACFGAGALLGSMNLWGRMQPASLGLVVRLRGWRCCAAAAGSVAGCILFWGRAGLQGACWAAGGIALALLHTTGQPRGLLILECIGLTIGVGMLFGLTGWPLAGQALVAGLSAGAAVSPLAGAAGAFGCALALGSRSPELVALAGGFAGAALPLGWALALSAGADVGGKWHYFTMTNSIAFLFIRSNPHKDWLRGCAPGLSLGLLLLLSGERQWGLLPLVALGGWLGALVPRRIPQRGHLGAAQVQLEGVARVLTRLQRQLLDWASLPPDVPELVRELRHNTCETCQNRSACLEQEGMNGALITGEGSFLCRKSALVEPELRRTRQILRRMQQFRARQEEYRSALVQQYGFLADALGEMADRLSPDGRLRAGFRVQVSSRSRSAHLSDGDRVAAFPAPGGKFYVLLCDGMGTGVRAAEESRACVELITQMLRSGLSPAAAMGSLNSQLTLTDRGGAVTVDLAELHPDTGRVFLYKWGAQSSWVLRHRRWIRIGAPGPPPGLEIGRGKESVSRVHLLRGDTLLMLSDGVSTNGIKDWVKIHRDNPPGELAALILRTGSDGTDDATAVVIRMVPKSKQVS